MVYCLFYRFWATKSYFEFHLRVGGFLWNIRSPWPFFLHRYTRSETISTRFFLMRETRWWVQASSAASENGDTFSRNDQAVDNVFSWEREATSATGSSSWPGRSFFRSTDKISRCCGWFNVLWVCECLAARWSLASSVSRRCYTAARHWRGLNARGHHWNCSHIVCLFTVLQNRRKFNEQPVNRSAPTTMNTTAATAVVQS